MGVTYIVGKHFKDEDVGPWNNWKQAILFLAKTGTLISCLDSNKMVLSVSNMFSLRRLRERKHM